MPSSASALISAASASGPGVKTNACSDPDNDLMVEINLAWENYNKKIIQEPIEEIIQVAEMPKPKQKIKITKQTKNQLVKTSTEFGESLGRLGGELIVKSIISNFFKVTK